MSFTVWYQCCVAGSSWRCFPVGQVMVSRCSIKGLSVREVMRIENMIVEARLAWYFNRFSSLLLYKMYRMVKRKENL